MNHQDNLIPFPTEPPAAKVPLTGTEPPDRIGSLCITLGVIFLFLAAVIHECTQSHEPKNHNHPPA